MRATVRHDTSHTGDPDTGDPDTGKHAPRFPSRWPHPRAVLCVVRSGLSLVTAMLALATTLGCVSGARMYSGGRPVDALASFTSPGCNVKTAAGVKASQAKFYLIHGRKSFSFLVLNRKGKGTEIENYERSDAGHTFAERRLKAEAWVYSFPDRRGADGKLEYYRSFTIRNRDGFSAIEGDPHTTCELKFQGSADGVPPEPADDPPTAEGSEAEDAETSSSEAEADVERVCSPGETRQCVGPGACEGGQACEEDGSGFGPCDCGPTSAPR